MKTIRCLRKILHEGELYLKKGETATVPDEQADRLIKAKHVEEVPAKKEK